MCRVRGGFGGAGVVERKVDHQDGADDHEARPVIHDAFRGDIPVDDDLGHVHPEDGVDPARGPDQRPVPTPDDSVPVNTRARGRARCWKQHRGKNGSIHAI